MIKYILISFLCLVGFPSAFGQSTIKEAYFHELRGMEDSSGVTHLFYRMYYSYSQECSYTNYEDERESYSINIHKNNLRQFNTKLKADTLRFLEGVRLWSECSTTYPKLYNYEFHENDPNNIFKISTDDGYSLTPVLTDWRGNRINLGATPANTIGIDTVKENLILPLPLEDILIKAPSSFLKKSFRVGFDGETWGEIDSYDLPDSVLIDFTILGVNPFKNEEYLGIKEDSLLRSTNHGDSLSLVLTDDYFLSHFPKIIFNREESVHYFISKLDVTPPSLKISVKSLNLENREPSLSSITLENSIHAISVDHSSTGRLYVADSSEVFISNDFGENFSSIKVFDKIITGLYKKPNSNILYVLTREELFEINTETKQTTSLKKLPVSNESEPSDIPNQVTLEQNYPNPFNPNTVISYQLNSNQVVNLEVFDVTGRKVAVLVNAQQKQAGKHQVTFGASGLSSGVYFYRLEAGGQTFTQKMLLVK